MSYHPKGRSWPNKTGIATKQDAIMTPVETSIQIINHFRNQISGICLDPCKGEGAFYDNLPKPKLWAEINLGIDFLEWDKKSGWEALLAVSITLIQENEPDITKRILFQKTYTSTQPCRQKNPRALSEAMSTAMSEVSEQIMLDIYSVMLSSKP